MTPDPLIEALARTILRHQLGCNQPAQPPAWMTAAAIELAAAIKVYGEFRAMCIAEKLT